MFRIIEAANEFGSLTIEGAPYLSNTQWRHLLAPLMRDWCKKRKLEVEPLTPNLFQRHLGDSHPVALFNTTFKVEGLEFGVTLKTDIKGEILSLEVSEPRAMECPLPSNREAFVGTEEYYSEGEVSYSASPRCPQPGWLKVEYDSVESRTAIIAIREDQQEFTFPIPA